MRIGAGQMGPVEFVPGMRLRRALMAPTIKRETKRYQQNAPAHKISLHCLDGAPSVSRQTALLRARRACLATASPVPNRWWLASAIVDNIFRLNLRNSLELGH